MENLPFISDFLNDSARIANSLNKYTISTAVDLLFEAWKSKNKVFIMGNGGSASTATHFVCDINKVTISEGKHRFRAFGLNDNIPWNSALTNDEGWATIFEEQLKNYFDPGDVVIGFSVHGGSGSDKAGAWSQNLLRAIHYAKDNGGKTIGFSGFDGGAMKDLCDVCVVVPANSTPQVESFHLLLEHLISFLLKEKIASYRPTSETIPLSASGSLV